MASTQHSDTAVFMGVGDLGPVYDPVDSFMELALPTLEQADLRFAQPARLYSERGSRPPYGGGPPGHDCRLPPSKASVFKPFDVVSLASNHTMDRGAEALFDTIQVMQGMEIEVCGAGGNIEAARRPAILRRNGVRVAFLGYCSVPRQGHAAGSSWAGLVPMQAYTYYEPLDDQPGTPPKVITVPYEDQLAALQEDITKAKEQADVVVMSIHWGIHHIPKVIAMYQPKVAHAAIDAGADLILGHHPHVLKGIEVYKGKVCFYSLGNFVLSSVSSAEVERFGSEVDSEYARLIPGWHFIKDSRYSLVVKALFSSSGVSQVSFLPTYANTKNQAEILTQDDERFNEVLNYTEWISDEFPHNFRVEGNEVVIEAPV